MWAKVYINLGKICRKKLFLERNWLPRFKKIGNRKRNRKLECFLSCTCYFVLFNTQISRNAYFNGESFIASSQKVSLFNEFEGGFNFRTLQPSGLLFYYSEGVSIYFFLLFILPFHFSQENTRGIIQFLTLWFNDRESSLQYRSIHWWPHFYT